MTTFPTRTTGTSAGRTTGTSAGLPPRPAGTRPVSAWAFAGVAVSIAGVMLVEYLVLSRLTGAVASWPMRRIIIAIGAVMVLAAPFTLINPERIYNDLLTPSLIALWLSQLIVFAVYPRFATGSTTARFPPGC